MKHVEVSYSHEGSKIGVFLLTIGFRGTHLHVLPYKTATVQSLGEIKPILETRDMGL